MKSIKTIIVSLIVILLCFVTVGCGNKKQTFSREQLYIISDSEDKYVIALTDSLGETNQYSMYKLMEYEEYEKLYDLDASNNLAVESHHVLWDNDKFYLIHYNIVAYDAETGKELYQSKSNIMPTDNEELCGTNTSIREIYGKDNEYIYYNYYCENNMTGYYAKVTLDLQKVEEIEESDIPNSLID